MAILEVLIESDLVSDFVSKSNANFESLSDDLDTLTADIEAAQGAEDSLDARLDGFDTRLDGIDADITALSSAELPGQAGNSGKVLTTDGATASWGYAIKPGQILLGPPGQTYDGFLEMDGSTILVASYPNLAGFDMLKSLTFTVATDSGTVLGTDSILAVCYGAKFVCVGTNNKIAHSTDGDNWTVATDSGSLFAGTEELRAVCYGNSTYVCVGDNGVIGYSSDGDNWTVATSSATVLSTNDIYGVCYGNSLFVCVGVSGIIAYSSDGDTWTAATDSTAPLGLYAVAYDATIGKFVAVGQNDDIWYSTDGDNWTEATVSNTFDGSNDFNCITSDGSNYFAYGDAGLSGYSSDGDNWTQLDGIIFRVKYNANYLILRAVARGGGLFVVGGSNSSMFYSADGKNWFALPDFSTTNVYGLCYGNSTFVAVGAAGAIEYGTISATNLYLPPADPVLNLSQYIKY